MSTIIFLSAVSQEFHERDPDNPQGFASYRDILASALRRCGPDYVVVVQEDLAQGFGDLLETLDLEVQRSQVVVHLIGNLAGRPCEEASVRRLRDRHQSLLSHEPELAGALQGTLSDVTYTQWELYLAFEHRCRRLVFQAQENTARSPLCTAQGMDDSQVRHLERLKSTGESRERFANQQDLVLKVVTSFLRFGVGSASPSAEVSAEAIAAAREDAEGLVHDIAQCIRKPKRPSSPELDLVGVDAFLQAVDTAALQRELDRRHVLEIAFEHRQNLRQAVTAEPKPAALYKLAFAELALGDFPQAMRTASQCAAAAEERMAADPDRGERHRELALNAYLLLHDAAVAARRRPEAIAALERGCRLIDRAKEPVLWADYHEQLAEYLLDQAYIPRANELTSEIIDIREEHQPESVALAKSLLLWCRLLGEKAKYADVIGVAARAERLFAAQVPPGLPGVAAALWYNARAQHRRGILSEAERLMRRALAIDEQAHGKDHAKVGASLNNLALVLLDMNRLAEAEALMRRALAIAEQAFGEDHPKVATCLDNLAVLLKVTNRMSEAEPLMQRALAINEQVYGKDHPTVAIRLNNLAQLLEATNRLAEAEPLMRRALAIDEQAHGNDHPNVARDLNNLALLLKATDRLSEAEPLMRRALTIDEAYGKHHPDVARDLNNLAMLLQVTNRLAEAEPLMRRALAINEQAYGKNHPDVATCLNNLALLLRATNRLAEAEPLMRRALAINEQAYGEDHANVGASLNNLASLLQDTNRLTEAEPLMRRALAIAEQAHGKNHPNVATSLNNLAVLLTATNRLAEAEPLMRRNVQILLDFGRTTGHEHPYMRAALSNYRGLLQKMRLSDAEIDERVREVME